MKFLLDPGSGINSTSQPPLAWDADSAHCVLCVHLRRTQCSALPNRQAALKAAGMQALARRAGVRLSGGRPRLDCRPSCGCSCEPGGLPCAPADGWASGLGSPWVNVPHVWPASRKELGVKMAQVALGAEPAWGGADAGLSRSGCQGALQGDGMAMLTGRG